MQYVDREPFPSHYGRLRVELDDLAPARWLERDSEGWAGMGTVASVCAPGFEAYARVLHPARLDERPVRWDRVAREYGRTVDGATCWHELIGAADRLYRNHDTPEIPGVWDEHPEEGPTPADVATALLPVLAAHTRTPERCWYGLWDGYGHLDWRGAPVFHTPGREEVLLSGPLADVASPAVRPHGAPPELPDLWWPEDRAWCVGGDVDLVSTYVGGTAECVDALLAVPGIEAHRVTGSAAVD
ncbi:hypothetical protein [Streptomyces sp. NPDC050504]|uniref:hypothetical protein n=1 Tax=Streptomyces sp. NPDC050504 TaxID=3365618 RepID=UPI0037A2A36A